MDEREHAVAPVNKAIMVARVDPRRLQRCLEKLIELAPEPAFTGSALAFGLFCTANLFFFALAVGHALSAVASILSVATVLIVRPYVNERVDDHWRRMRGGLVERAVGERLDALRYEGWILMHGVSRVGWAT